jgi:hypothetical protein
MKYFNLLVLSLFFFGCSQTNKDTKTIGENGITETTLPKGKYILEEETKNRAVENTPLGDAKNNSTAIENNKVVDNPLNDVKRRFKNLLVFHAADTMKIGKSYLATLVVGKDQLLGDLKTEIFETGKIDDNEIKQDTTLDIGTKMRANLIGMSGIQTKGFTIEMIGGNDVSTQSITEKRKKIIWQWKLTPQTEGLQELKLSINIVEKNDEVVNLPTRNIPIMIFAEKEGFFSSIGSFFKNDTTKWLLSAILIPIFVGWYTTKNKNIVQKKSGRKK